MTLSAIPADLALKGSKVLLVPSQPQHYSELQKILSDLKTMKHLKYLSHFEEGGWTLQGITDRFETRRKKQDLGECVDFIITDVKTGEVMGNCGLVRMDLKHRNAEYGIIVHHPFWNLGIATECYYLCLEYAFSVLKLHRIEFNTFTTNTSARKSLEKIGIQLEAYKKECFWDEGQFKDDAVYALLESQWEEVKQKLTQEAIL